ncbi:alpha/beta fold hydrolase [Rhizobium sp. LEGMi198b]
MSGKQPIPPKVGTIWSIGDGRVHFLEKGVRDKEPVILLHGCGSIAEELLLPFEDSEFRVIAPDRPGYGLSTPIPASECGPIGQSFWLERFLDCAGFTGLTIVAHSIGSAPALHLAARRPDLISKLFLISPCCSPVPPKAMLILRAASAPLVGGLVRQHVISRWATFFVGQGLRASSFPNTVPSRLDGLPASHLVNPLAVQTMADELRAFNRDMQLLPSLPPHLIIHVLFGLSDAIIHPALHIDWLRRKHPAAFIKVLDGVGHLPHHVAPDEARNMLANLICAQMPQGSERLPLDHVA